jgi:hypothetical protein
MDYLGGGRHAAEPACLASAVRASLMISLLDRRWTTKTVAGLSSWLAVLVAPPRPRKEID